MLAVLTLAALLEIGGVAAMRYGLLRSAWIWVSLGGLGLVVYGITLNLERAVDFGRLMGTYIAVFFLVSQAMSWIVFGERPAPGLVVGGVLVVIGGLIIQLGAGRAG